MQPTEHDIPSLESVEELFADWSTLSLEDVAKGLGVEINQARWALYAAGNRGIVRQVSIRPALWRRTSTRRRPVNGALRPKAMRGR